MPSAINRIMSLIVFRFLLLVMLAAGAACGKGCGSSKQADGGFVLSEACKRAYGPTLDAYERATGQPVPAECRMLDKTYRVQVIADKEELRTLCGVMDLAENEMLNGCWVKRPPLLLIEQMDERAMTDTAVHEWIHIIHYCATSGEAKGDDSMHMDGKLWEDFMNETHIPVEIQARAAAEAGKCVL